VESPVTGNELPPVAVEEEHFSDWRRSIVSLTGIVSRLGVVSGTGIITETSVVPLLISVIQHSVIGSVGIAGLFLGIPGLILRIDRSFASQDQQRQEK
jgi:hypothetical protein